MRRAFVSFGLWALSAGAAAGGCSSRGGDDAPHIPLPEMSDAGARADAEEPFPALTSFFEAEARIGPPGVSGGRYPETFRLTVALDASQTLGVFGVTGRFSRFHRTSSYAEDGISFGLGESPCPQHAEAVVNLSSPTFVVEDTTGDGIADRITGAMRGRVNTVDASDVVDVTYSGVRDDRPPSLSARWSTPSNPIDMIFIDATEPLPLGLGLRLVGDSAEPIFDLTGIPLDGALISSWGRGYPLPFGGSWHVEATPELRDLAGNVGTIPANAALRTAPDPGVFAEDGFEGPMAALTSGRAFVVDAATIAPIHGARSLLILPSDGTETAGRVTFRLRTPPSTRAIHWSYRALTTTIDSPYLQASVVGPGRTVFGWNGPGGAEPSGVGAPSLIGPVDEIAGLPLGSTHADEVILDFATAGSCGGATMGPGVGMLIDDLRVE